MSDPRTWAELLDAAEDGPKFAQVLEQLIAAAQAAKDDNE